MNIKEAINKIKEIIYWSNGEKAEHIDIGICKYGDEINCEEFIEAIETVLNELERLKEYEYMYKDLCKIGGYYNDQGRINKKISSRK